METCELSQNNSKIAPIRFRIFPAMLRRLRSVGIHLEPFYTVREGETELALPAAEDQIRFGFLEDDEFGELCELSKSEGRQEIQSWLDQGKLCFVARDGKRLIANMWCDLTEFNYKPNYRRLDEDEAYLFAAFSHPDYRGQNLAPRMRASCYEALREKGRSRFYSYTEYFNIPARRFKEKLGAENETLRLYACLFGKWSVTVTLRKFH